jgi:hypothetical protein
MNAACAFVSGTVTPRLLLTWANAVRGVKPKWPRTAHESIPERPILAWQCSAICDPSRNRCATPVAKRVKLSGSGRCMSRIEWLRNVIPSAAQLSASSRKPTVAASGSSSRDISVFMPERFRCARSSGSTFGRKAIESDPGRSSISGNSVLRPKAPGHPYQGISRDGL